MSWFLSSFFFLSFFLSSSLARCKEKGIRQKLTSGLGYIRARPLLLHSSFFRFISVATNYYFNNTSFNNTSFSRDNIDTCQLRLFSCCDYPNFSFIEIAQLNCTAQRTDFVISLSRYLSYYLRITARLRVQ